MWRTLPELVSALSILRSAIQKSIYTSFLCETIDMKYAVHQMTRHLGGSFLPLSQTLYGNIKSLSRPQINKEILCYAMLKVSVWRQLRWLEINHRSGIPYIIHKDM